MSIEGLWHNQHGSVMSLTVGADGRLRGTFESGVGLSAGAGSFELAGFAAGDLVAFTVDFREHGSLTAWTGHVATVDGVEQMSTLWQMTVTIPHPGKPGELWKGIWSGADTFRRGRPTGVEQRLPERPSHPLRAG